MHEAPRARSFWGRGRNGNDPEKMREAFERFNRRRGGPHSIGIFTTAGPGLPPPSGMQESPLEFWYSEREWRIDHGATRTIGTSSDVFRFHLGMGGVVTSLAEQPSVLFDGFGTYFAPASLLGSLHFRIVDEVVHRDRSCWRVATEIITSRLHPFLPLLHGGDDFELWIDQAVGIIVRCEGRLDGELASVFEIDELVVDDPIDREVFAFVTPDGSPVRTHGEMQLEHLRRQGVAVSGIDPSDPDQVDQAMQAPLAVLEQLPDVEQLAAQHIPTGPPPDDEENARIEVRAAFERMGEVSADGTAAVSVQRGENLGPCVGQARRLIPQGQTPSIRVEKIKFLRADEAVVWTTILLDINVVVPLTEGRAVFVDGQWKVSRATFCERMATSGITCPPPPEPS
jgi:hypothetical protein